MTIYFTSWRLIEDYVKTIKDYYWSFTNNFKSSCIPDGKSKVDGGKHGEACDGDHAHEDVGEEPQMFIIK